MIHKTFLNFPNIKKGQFNIIQTNEDTKNGVKETSQNNTYRKTWKIFQTYKRCQKDVTKHKNFSCTVKKNFRITMSYKQTITMPSKRKLGYVYYTSVCQSVLQSVVDIFFFRVMFTWIILWKDNKRKRRCCIFSATIKTRLFFFFSSGFIFLYFIRALCIII